MIGEKKEKQESTVEYSDTNYVSEMEEKAINYLKGEVTQEEDDYYSESDTLRVIQEEEEEVEETKEKVSKSKHRHYFLSGYKNFDNRQDRLHDISDFNWEFNAIELYSQYMPDLTEQLSALMRLAFGMTNNQYGKKTNIDTSYFRSSIIYYLQMIHGLRDDQFNTQGINQVLQISQKKYIKKVGCSPELLE